MAKNNRKANSIKNALVSTFSNILTLLIGFVAQAVFIKTLGPEYLGLNGLFSNIISALAIVELGIGPAIIYSLYKPLSTNNKEEIKSLLNFYKKAYNIIAIVIFVLGIAIMPVLPFFVNTTLNINIYIVFLLFLFDVICSYLLSYKRSIIQADQQNYIINIVHIGYILILNLIQIGILLTSKNYFLYLLVRVIMRLIENIIITVIANKKYDYLKDKDIKPLDKTVFADIKQKVKGLIFHKLGGIVVLSTDNIIISKMLGTVTVGYYSNYYMIINSLSILFSQIFTSITASVGNLLVKEDSSKSYNVFKVIMMINFWIYGFAAICLFILIEPFITLWVGSEFILAKAVLIILVLNFYITGMKASIGVYKDAAGIFWEDRYIPVIESIINIVASVIFAKFFGLAGVFLGTLISSFVVVFFSLPYYVFKKVFNKNILEYYKEYAKYFIVTLLTLIMVLIITTCFKGLSPFMTLVINAVICILVVNTIFYIVFRKTPEFEYIFNMIKGILGKFRRK